MTCATPWLAQTARAAGSEQTAVSTLPTGAFHGGSGTAIEIPSLRTRTSRTIQQDGHYVAQISAQSMNYQDATGNWQPIDDSIVPSATPGYLYQNKANAYTVTFPASLSTPVRVSAGTAWLSFSLEGGSGNASFAGNTVRYPTAGGAIAFAAEPDAMKETISLTGPTSPSTYVYDVQLSPGLTLQQNSTGGIDVVTGAGSVALTIPAPFMTDASGAVSHAVSLTLGENGTATTLTVAADPSWLSDPARSWPVVIDPTVQTITTGDICVIYPALKTPAGCKPGSYGNTAPGLTVGQDATTTYHALARFKVYGVIPANAEVLNADIAFTLASSLNQTPVSLSMYEEASPWLSELANWTTYDSSHPWLQGPAGGDQQNLIASLNGITPPPPGQHPTYHFSPTAAVQGWVNHTVTNDGVLLTLSPGSQQNDLTMESTGSVPTLTVTYHPWVGEQSFYTSVNASLSAGLSASVNVADGNLLLHQSDLSMPGIGLPLTIDRYYNSLAGSTGPLGNNWVLGMAPDVGLQTGFSDGSVILYAPSGYQLPFIASPQPNQFLSPPGIDATLIRNNDGSYTLTYHQSQATYSFNSGGYLVSHADRSGNTIRYGYNGSNQLTTITDTQGRITTVSYASPVSPTLISRITDPAGRTYSYAYDASKNLVTSTNPLNQSTSFTYNSANQLTGITDPNGNQTTYLYNSLNEVSSFTRVTNSQNGTGPTTSFSYTANQDGTGSTVVTDPNNHQTTYDYDNYGRGTATVDALGHSYSTSWSPDDQPTSSVMPSGATTTIAYDGLNNETQVTSPTNATQSSSYGNATFPYNPTASTDAQGNGTGYGYTGQGLLATETDGLGHQTTFTYNSNGTLATKTDANGHVTSYSYYTSGTETGLLEQVTPPAGSGLGVETTTYTSANLPATSTDGKGQTTTYSYDALGRMTQASYKTSGGLSAGYTAYAYDPDGNELSVTDGPGTSSPGITSYLYDALNRRISETLPPAIQIESSISCPGASGSVSLCYSYDAVGNLLSKADGIGSTSYGYDADNRVTSVTPSGQSAITFSYDNDSNQTQIAFPSGLKEGMAYNGAKQLISIGASTGSTSFTTYTYSYTQPGGGEDGGKATSLRYSLTETNAGVPGYSDVTSYGYDGDNRLTAATATDPVASWAYSYDPVGNMLSSSRGGVSSTMSYNSGNELTSLTQGGTPSTYSYDANGNQTGVSTGAAAVYNPQNQTTSQTPAGGQPIAQSYSGTGQAGRVTNGGASYEYDVTGLDLIASGGAITRVIRGPSGQLLAEEVTGSVYDYLTDGLGSVVSVVDSSGVVKNSYAYDPYGNTISSQEQVSNPFRYIGGVWDASTGFYKLGARYYDASVGRFTQPDPGACALSTNAYWYSDDDPISQSDPSGLIDSAGIRLCFEHMGLHGKDLFACMTMVVGAVTGKHTPQYGNYSAECMVSLKGALGTLPECLAALQINWGSIVGWADQFPAFTMQGDYPVYLVGTEDPAFELPHEE